MPAGLHSQNLILGIYSFRITFTNKHQRPNWSTSEFAFGIRERFPGGERMYLLFNSSFVNFLLKTKVMRHSRHNLVVFVVWSAKTIYWWVVVTRSRKSYSEPAEIASIAFLVLFKNEGCRISQRIHLFVSDVNQGNEKAGRFQDFLAGFQGWKDSS